MNDIFKKNNFDIIRLFAALQVSIIHFVNFFKMDFSNSFFIEVLRLFPGVPIFFFISGYLISRSYKNSPTLKSYFINRALRIYPALIVCTLFSFISVYLTGYHLDAEAHEVILWLLGQITVVQFYNPEFMREFGTGVLNGSLWTISVEIQFYFLVPLLYYFYLNSSKKQNKNVKLILLVLFFTVFHEVHYFIREEYGKIFLIKIHGATFIPWVYMFLFGVFVQINFEKFYNLFAKKNIYLFPLYLILSYCSVYFFGFRTGNGLNPLLYFFLAITVFSFAYSYPLISKKTLKGNDISYGLYIYNAPVRNLFIFYRYDYNISFLILGLFIVSIIASASWFFIERPALALKKYTLYVHK